MTNTTISRPDGQLHGKVRAWLSDRRQQFAPSPVANPGWYGTTYLLADFIKHTHGHPDMAQQDFRRVLRTVGVPVVKTGNLWFARVDESLYAHPKKHRSRCHVSGAAPDSTLAILMLFAVPTDQSITGVIEPAST